MVPNFVARTRGSKCVQAQLVGRQRRQEFFGEFRKTGEISCFNLWRLVSCSIRRQQVAVGTADRQQVAVGTADRQHVSVGTADRQHVSVGNADLQ